MAKVRRRPPGHHGARTAKARGSSTPRGRAGVLGRAGRRKVPRGRLTTTVAPLVVGAALAAGGYGLWASRQHDTAVRIDFARTPSSYRIVYRVEYGSGDDQVVTTDKVWVRRPWESRLESWTGPPPGADRLSTQVAVFGRRVTAGAEGEPLVFDLVPAVPASDVRLAPSLGAAVGRKLVVDEHKEHVVAGRTCRVYRSGTVFGDTTYTRPGDDAVESCVDEAGLVLEEVVLSGARRISRRIAAEVEEGGATADDLFAADGTALGVKDGGGYIRQADPKSRPIGEFFELPEPPAGWRMRGRYTVVPPQPENFTDPLKADRQLAGTADVYERGRDLLVIDQGGTRRRVDAFAPDKANPTVELGKRLAAAGGGKGEVLIGPRGNEVRAALSGGRYIRVYGTLPVDELARIARSLRRVEGKGLTYL